MAFLQHRRRWFLPSLGRWQDRRPSHAVGGALVELGAGGVAHPGSHPYVGDGGRPMTNSYARDGFAYGFDFTRLRSREERVARLDALATLLDTAFILPGTNVRFGFDALIGLVPGIGDAITTAISLYIVHEARQLGAPTHLILRMLANVAVDGFVGAVPLVGDAFDVLWRANRRNVRLLREWLAREDAHWRRG
jgi:hypothetical protein